MRDHNTIPILVADDDLDDCEMIREALTESRLLNELQFVHDGEALIKTLHDKWAQSQDGQNLMPGLILLDLNMPKMDGREVLTELKKHPHLYQIPVIVLTTSQAEEDIVRSYNLGANSFITKPIEFESLVQVMRDVGRYWFEIVALPNCAKKVTK
tara:strand:+ start:15503 stop:15967 length:465 start_codon:yes stop_codon:yes gene_type:complete